MGVTSCATLPFLPGTHVFSTVFKLLQANSTLFKHLWLVTANSDMRSGSSDCRSKFIIRNSHATAQNLKERLSGFFQFFTAQPVNIPVLIHFNLGILLIYYGGPIRILTVFDFAKFRQYTQQGISISIPFRAAGTIQHHQCTRPYLGTLRIGFRIDDSRHWRVITSSPSMRK